MKGIVIALVLVAFVLVPSVTVPEASACQPYEVYCPITGTSHWACSGKVPGAGVECVKDLLRP